MDIQTIQIFGTQWYVSHLHNSENLYYVFGLHNLLEATKLVLKESPVELHIQFQKVKILHLQLTLQMFCLTNKTQTNPTPSTNPQPMFSVYY